MILTDRDKEIIKQYLDRNEHLPPKYKPALFDDVPEAELIWRGKTPEVTNVVLPFQSIEHIDEPRLDFTNSLNFPLIDFDLLTGRQVSGWTNKLIWGDNKLILSSLKNGPIKEEIEKAGGIKLVYIDPPFDVGANFNIELEVGYENMIKSPTVIEEVAYRDTWGKGIDSFIAMIYERLWLIKDLLAPDGSVFVHCDWRVDGYIRLILDEIFGFKNHVNEIIWCFSQGAKSKKMFGRKHNTIYFYSKNIDHQIFNGDKVRTEMKSGKTSFGGRLETDNEGRQYRLVYGSKNRNGETRYYKYYLDQGKIPEDYWSDINSLQSGVSERLNYPTQKPESLLNRIILASSNEGDIIADFFCGSGTTLAVAEKLNRKWIGSDLSRFAIHTSRKRLINIQRELKTEKKTYRSFEILNLGKYERQYFIGINPNLPEKERKKISSKKEEEYLSLILQAYKAERALQLIPFHGRKNGTVVFIGPIDSPVTITQIKEILKACVKLKLTKIDVLGFEFEMGLIETYKNEANQRGVDLSIRYIPKDVFDKRAVEKDQVRFFDASYIEVVPQIKKRRVTILLKDFGVFYNHDDISLIASELKPGGSKIIIQKGQIVKVTKDKKGIIRKPEVLTKKWSDWIDYWSIDFDFESKKEIIKQLDEKGKEKEVWTGEYVFENMWQSFRTRKDRNLEFSSIAYEYPKSGKYKIAVKVIDIFGNDTTKVIEVKV